MCLKTIDFVASQVCWRSKVRKISLNNSFDLSWFCTVVQSECEVFPLVAGMRQPVGLANKAGCEGFHHRFKCIFVIVCCTALCVTTFLNITSIYYYIEQRYFPVLTFLPALNNITCRVKRWNIYLQPIKAKDRSNENFSVFIQLFILSRVQSRWFRNTLQKIGAKALNKQQRHGKTAFQKGNAMSRTRITHA